MSKIVCLGILVADLIAKPVNQFPAKGKLTNVDAMELHTGGCATNSAIDLAKLGEDVGVIGLIGSDHLGSFILNRLKAENVDITGVKQTVQSGTSTSMVFSDPDGERSFLYYPGTNGIFAEGDIDFSVIERCEILFIAGSLLMPTLDGEPTARLLKRTQQLGKYTILDTAWDPTGKWMSAISPCLPYLNLFIPSIEEAQMLSGKDNVEDMAKVFLTAGAQNVVIKCGSKGCYVENSTEKHYQPAYKVNAIDANGAGDSFVAGFIAGLANKWELKRCAKFANAVGAHCVTALGASSGIKSKEEIILFIENRSTYHDQ
ncbi:carbohydrate kinase family protein [Pelosinus propionicus]|uniref:Sugar or nucleoside kinase, ribokinase family n=1 Tax=Pelosinus propionicus DSM 13327 TaxID=1123291 RepID=A0A1I4PJR0_9FIRM|nr:carbohydrate kinase family protein [Pelosinus propionicus]SFM27884.1 Sugar or nucleoside kinase, ribokinase family [Pelosinus propionicus DSM 13327]